jgi:hypothetical protein
MLELYGLTPAVLAATAEFMTAGLAVFDRCAGQGVNETG